MPPIPWSAATALVAAVAALGCGTESSVPHGAPGSGGDAGASNPGQAIFNGPAAGALRGRTFPIRSTSLRLESDRNILTLRDYEANCGVVDGGLPPSDSISVHVVVFLTEPGQEIIAYADKHSATFQIGIDPKTVETIAARSGVVRFDKLSLVPGETIAGAIDLRSDLGDVAGTFEGKVCPRP